jgi:hypothetical protein
MAVIAAGGDRARRLFSLPERVHREAVVSTAMLSV